MPNTDLRIQLSFRDHPKRKKLERRLGKEGVLSLIWLWAHAAANKPDGLLAGMDAEDIALAGEWEGAAEDFVGVLLELRLLDQVKDGYQIHDWPVHNPWAAKAEERSQLARAAARARWDAERMRGAMPDDAECMRPASIGIAPLLSSPSPIPSQEEVEGNGEVFLPIPLKDKTEYLVTTAQVREWAETYPALGRAGVEQGLRDARDWCIRNPGKRKTRRGAMNFLGSWLQRNHKELLEKQPEGGQIPKPSRPCDQELRP